jgi:hypothetical protein
VNSSPLVLAVRPPVARPSLYRVVAPCSAALVLTLASASARTDDVYTRENADRDRDRVELHISRLEERMESRFDRLWQAIAAVALIGTGAGGVLAYREGKPASHRRKDEGDSR